MVTTELVSRSWGGDGDPAAVERSTTAPSRTSLSLSARETAPRRCRGPMPAPVVCAVLRNYYDVPTEMWKHMAFGPTGSGPTTALFLLRAVNGLAPTGSGQTTALVLLEVVNGLTATAATGGGGDRRDLDRYGRATPLRFFLIMLASAGESAQKQNALETGVDTRFATAGNSVDMLLPSSVSVKAIQDLVIDEADMMLDVGFERQMQQPITSGFGEAKLAADSLMHSMCTKVFPATVINCELSNQKSIERSWTRLQPSIARACLFSLVLLLLFSGCSASTPISENEFNMKFYPLNTSETCPVPQFKRPLRTHNIQLAEQLLREKSERRILVDQDPKCNNSQSLDFKIVSTWGPIISFMVNFGPIVSMVGIEEADETRQILLASSSFFISASNMFWAWYQHVEDCPSLLLTIIFSLAAFLHGSYFVLFLAHTDRSRPWSFGCFVVIIAVGLVVKLSISTVSILALIALFMGHVARLAAIRRYRTPSVWLAGCGLFGFSAFYEADWKIQTLIVELLVHLYFYRRAHDEDAARAVQLARVLPEDGERQVSGIAAIAQDGAVIQDAAADGELADPDAE